METRLIQLYTKGEIVLTFAEKANGLVVVLLDDNNTPSAKYGFDKEKLKSINKIVYQANNVRIHFEGITPSSKSEIESVSE